MIEDILLFKSAGVGRGTNGSNNGKREDILCVLHTPPEHSILDVVYGQKWAEMSLKWNQFLKTLCPHEYESIEIKKIANRKSYDLDIRYKKQNQIVHTVIGEFKHNAKSLSKIPQYYSPAENHRYISACYAEFFYDNYLDRICALSNIQKPDKVTYLNTVYQSDHDVNPFYGQLRECETSFYKQKQAIVRESIKDYLQTYGQTIQLDLLTADLQQQAKKTFILWDLNQFHAETIQPDELCIEKFDCIKRNNTVVLVSKAGTKHNLLLRWRNRLGVLLPAWQISLER